MVRRDRYERYAHSLYWTTARLERELALWQTNLEEIADALDEAVEEEGALDWEDLSEEWDDSISDYHHSVDEIDTLEAVLALRRRR